MSAANLRCYRVRVSEHAIYEIVIEAPDCETAEQCALAKFERNVRRFKYVDGSYEISESEEAL